jgi:6-phosphofructokinase 1
MSKNKIKKIAVFTSGGDAPGMNAAIRAVVRTATYHKIEVLGIMQGYDGMINGVFEPLRTQDVGNIIHRGGTILRSARSDEFRTPEGRQKAYASLKAAGVDACIGIGGNGTFTGAMLFSNEFNMPFIGLPGTIDNDLYGTDCTIGFDTAINTATSAMDKIRDTADSHNRLFFIEVMGRHSGFIAMHSGIGVGAGSIFIPENPINCVDTLIKVLEKGERRNKLVNLVIVAEGSACGGAMEVSAQVKAAVGSKYDIKVTVIGHLQRGGSPSCFDRVLASRLGFSAVEALMEGKSNVMVGMMDNKISYTSFEEAIKNDKPLDQDLIRMAEILAL